MYINGNLEATTTNAGLTGGTAGTVELTTGSKKNNGGSYFEFWNGTLDQVRIYNYARTPAQIAYEYNRGAPIAHYQFDECQGTTIFNSARTAGNQPLGNHGTLTIGASDTNTSAGTCTGSSGQAWYTGNSGKINHAMSFDGTDDYTSITDNDRLDFGTSGQFSLAAWINPTTLSTNQTIIAKKTGNGAGQAGYLLNLTSSGKINVYVSDGTNQLFRASSTLPTTDTWYHTVFTFSSTNTNLYTNGNPDVTGSTNNYADITGSISNSQNLIIGAESDLQLPFSGLIDDVRIYNYALTPLQVKDIYNGGNVVFR